jgi:glyoxylate reductase
MMKAKVALSRILPDSGMIILDEQCDLLAFPEDRQIRKDELISIVSDADGLICMLTDPVGKDVIDAAPRLQCISSYAVGYNNIDLQRAKERGITVTNTPGVLTDATADIAFALMISVARRIVESDAWIRTHRFEGWAPKLFLGRDLVGKSLGIIGAGRIGKALAKRAKLGFDMNILYHNRNRDDAFEQQYNARYVELEELLSSSDYISIHTPLTPDTKHLIGKPELERMKPGAILINTARGPVVDEEALIQTLEEGIIFGAGLDVYEDEPEVPQKLKALPNVVILPHIGSASLETRDEMAVIAVENCLAVLNGREPRFKVI